MDNVFAGELTYMFSFTQSDHRISLTESQLRHIPYLDVLVSNVDKFVCYRNEFDTFVLHDPIQHVLLDPILSAALHGKPSHLFMKLPRHASVVEMLHLYEYLCVDAPMPLSLKPMKEIYNAAPSSFSKNYQDASPSEARDSAVEFVVAIANGTYDLDDVVTIRIIFDLLVDILSFSSVFGPRLRYQTLVVIENYCWHIFTLNQQALLRAYKRSLERLDDSDADADDDTCQTVEAPGHHLFRWRRRARLSKPRKRCSAYLLFPFPPQDHSSSYTGLFEDPFYLRNYRRRSRCERCYRLDEIQDPFGMLDLWGFYYDWGSCGRCEKRDRFSYLKAGLTRTISCPCGYLRDWVKRECESGYSQELKVVFEFYCGGSPSLSRLDFKVATCLMNCCSKLQTSKDKRERRSMYAYQLRHLQSNKRFDKFHNQHGIRPYQHRR